ncbi:N-acetylmuramoyl-L-alanine amidase family protein [Eubacteriales bacterium KG125]
MRKIILNEIRKYIGMILGFIILSVYFFSALQTVHANQRLDMAISHEKKDKGAYSVFFDSKEKGEIPVKNGEIHLSVIDEGVFILKNSKDNSKVDGVTWSAPVSMKSGILSWIDEWILKDGHYCPYNLRVVQANALNEKLGISEQFSINCIKSNVEEIKLFLDNQEVSSNELVEFSSNDYRKISLKARNKGDTEFRSIPNYSVDFVENGEPNEYIVNSGYLAPNPKTKGITKYQVQMKDKTACFDFSAKIKEQKVESIDVKVPKIAYIDRWNALSGDKYIGITQKRDEITENRFSVNIFPKGAKNQNVIWESLSPEIAEYQELYGYGIIPKRAGIAIFEIHSEDNPNARKTVSIDFRYKYPLAEAIVEKEEYELEEGDFIPFVINTLPANATEQRFKWIYDKNDIVKITDKIKVDEIDNHITEHTIEGLKQGTVKVKGIPYDDTHSAKPVEFIVKVNNKNQSPPNKDSITIAKELELHGKKQVKRIAKAKYGNEWNIFTLYRTGGSMSKTEEENYIDSVNQILRDTEETPQDLQPTDYARILLALGSMNKETSNNISIKIIERLSNFNYENLSVNQYIFTLIALDSKGYKVPIKSVLNRDYLIKKILKAQGKDGRIGDGIDITAMAIQALAPYEYTHPEVTKSIKTGLKFLSSELTGNAGYIVNGSNNASSAAQVVIAISSLGKDLRDLDGFVKNGKNLICNLKSFKTAGGFANYARHETDFAFATYQVTMAVNSFNRLIEERKNIYDLNGNSKNKLNFGWKRAGNTWRYFSASGAMATGWKHINGKWYLFDSINGDMKTGWEKVGRTWYYLNPSGAMATGWKYINGKWYLFDSINGDMKTGWQKVGRTWYYLNPSGAMATGWKYINGKWYLFDSINGDMKTGWQKIGRTWYYLNPSGAMATGWQKISNIWHKFASSGAWIR